tara:strand:- start:11139 stop:11483 length:345 start_codon:yes stop_codon:yes gene_type:complete
MELNYQNFNEIGYEELCKLPGVGKATAGRIIAQRPFHRDADLSKVRGLGKGTLKKLGIANVKKRQKSIEKCLYHPYEGDDVEYPHHCFAYDTRNSRLDFFWRIPQNYRKYYEVD